MDYENRSASDNIKIFKCSFSKSPNISVVPEIPGVKYNAFSLFNFLFFSKGLRIRNYRTIAQITKHPTQDLPNVLFLCTFIICLIYYHRQDLFLVHTQHTFHAACVICRLNHVGKNIMHLRNSLKENTFENTVKILV